MKSLTLLRHAKSSWADPGLDDAERPLNERGRKAAKLMGEAVRARGNSFDVILVSTAKRTQETADIFCPIACPGGARRDVATLYMAGTHDIIALARAIDDRFDHALLIGHNPGFHGAALALGQPGDGDQRVNMQRKFPTAALASHRFAIERWRDLNRGAGELHIFLTPKDLG